MRSQIKRIAAGLATAALLATGLVASSLPASAEDINVPKVAWPACDDFRTDFCIESVKIQPLGTKTALELKFEKTKVAATPAPTTPVSESASVSPTPTTPAVDRVAGNAVAGIWTHENWETYGLNAAGYDGLTIDMKAANQFTNNIFFTTYPGMFDASGKPSIALKNDGSKLALDMDIDSKITITARIGAVKTGISIGVANNLSKTSELGTEDNPGKLIMTGTPVPVPQITNVRQCEGESGVASAVVTTMQGFIVVETETSGFGVDGLSGRMAISSNGVSCGISTPVWDEASETLTWEAGAPHFRPDGVTPNLGFYKAVIPANDALLLWGLSDPTKVVSALQVNVISQEGGAAQVSAKNISYLYGNIIIEATGFEYSKPKIQIKKIASYKGFVKPKTFECVDPLTKKKAVFKDAYGCPKAPSKPVQNFVTSAFANTKSTLTTAHQNNVKSYLKKFPEAQMFVCTGVHKANASASDKSIAKKRADAICAYAKKLNKTLTYTSLAQASSSAGYQNKVLITMRSGE
jgi:hypothetical protein